MNNDPIKVNTNNDSEASVVITPDNWVIGANSSLPLNIGAVVAAQVQDIVSNHVFTIDFVAGWDKAVSGANNYMITLAKSVEGGLIDSSIDSILAIGGNMPSIPDAVPNDPDMKFDGWFISGSDTNIKNITTISFNISIFFLFYLILSYLTFHIIFCHILFLNGHMLVLLLLYL